MAAKRTVGRSAVRSRPKSNPGVRWIKRGLILLAIVCSLAVIFAFVVGLNAYREAPTRMDALMRRVDDLNKRPTQILSSDQKVLYQVSSENRLVVKFGDIPLQMRNAMIAAEDKRFYEHSGVDFIGVIRSLREAARTQRASQGASTLTMQLAKLLSDGTQKTLSRKIDDIALAIYMERQMTKDQILALYLNTVYFGEGAHGIAAAAKVYFGKELKDLTIGECAMLARCVQRPIVNPIRNLPKAIENRDVVLSIMREENMIDASQYQDAVAERPRVNPRPQRTSAFRPNGSEYFVDHVLALLKHELPGIDLKSGGYTIETTLDSRLQANAEEVVRENVEKFGYLKVNTAAIVLIDRDGEILAEVGGANYRRNSYNAVTQGRMQPGSGFKPFVYASAFKDGVLQSVDDMVSNAPIRKPDRALPGGYWTPHNDTKKTSNPSYTVRSALAYSINLPAIHTIEAVGPEKVVQYAHDNFGFRSNLEPYEPLALGASEVSPLEMAEAYSVFMLHGDRVRPFAIKRIIGPDGQVLRDFEPQYFRGVWDPAICDKIETLLKGVVEYGTAAGLINDIPDARGKTGTTSKNTDAWFNGYADGLLAIGWCANERIVNGVPSRRPMSPKAFGGTVTVPIWRDVMKLALKLRPQNPIIAQTPAPAGDDSGGAKFKQNDGDATSPDESQPTPDPSDQQPTPIPTSPPAAGANGGAPADTTGGIARTGTATSDAPPKPPESNAVETTAKPADSSKKGDTQQYVYVEICSESGMKATIYCPETTSHKYKKGTEPTKTCTIHTGNQR